MYLFFFYLFSIGYVFFKNLLPYWGVWTQASHMYENYSFRLYIFNLLILLPKFSKWAASLYIVGGTPQANPKSFSCDLPLLSFIFLWKKALFIFLSPAPIQEEAVSLRSLISRHKWLLEPKSRILEWSPSDCTEAELRNICIMYIFVHVSIVWALHALCPGAHVAKIWSPAIAIGKRGILCQDLVGES